MIKIKGTEERAEKIIKNILDNLNKTEFKPDICFRSEIIEIKGFYA